MLLGLAAPPYYCLVSIQPIIVWSGILMTMEGSSGAPAPGRPGGGPITQDRAQDRAQGLDQRRTNIGHLVVSEVYYQADQAHGGKIEDQWIEIYNGSGASADIFSLDCPGYEHFSDDSDRNKYSR